MTPPNTTRIQTMTNPVARGRGDNGRLALLEHLCFGDSADHFDDPRYQQANPLALWEADSSGAAPHGIDSDEMDNLGWTQDGQVAFDLDQEFDPPALGDLSVSRSESKRSTQVGLDDFEVEEAFAVRLLLKHIRNTFQLNTSERVRRKSIEWVFVGLTPPNEVDFTTCCNMLGVREYVLKTRIHYEFYLRWIVYHEFPFLALPMPEELKMEIFFTCGMEGVDIARHAWYHPGVDVAEIYQRESTIHSAATIREVLADLEHRGYISRRVANVYCTGRNPAKSDGVQCIERQVKQPRVIWSRLW